MIVLFKHFYTSPHKDWQKYWVLQCSSWAAYTNSQKYPITRNIFSLDIGPTLGSACPFYAPDFAYWFTHPILHAPDPIRSGLTDPVLGLLSRSGRCWACLSTSNNKTQNSSFEKTNSEEVKCKPWKYYQCIRPYRGLNRSFWSTSPKNTVKILQYKIDFFLWLLIISSLSC